MEKLCRVEMPTPLPVMKETYQTNRWKGCFSWSISEKRSTAKLLTPSLSPLPSSEPRSVRALLASGRHVLFLSSRGRSCPFQDLWQLLSRRVSSASTAPPCVPSSHSSHKGRHWGLCGPREVAKPKLFLVVRETLPESLIVALSVENHVLANFRAEALQ